MTSLVEELLELSAKVGESRYLVELLLVYANGFKSIFFFLGAGKCLSASPVLCIFDDAVVLFPIFFSSFLQFLRFRCEPEDNRICLMH